MSHIRVERRQYRGKRGGVVHARQHLDGGWEFNVNRGEHVIYMRREGRGWLGYTVLLGTVQGRTLREVAETIVHRLDI